MHPSISASLVLAVRTALGALVLVACGGSTLEDTGTLGTTVAPKATTTSTVAITTTTTVATTTTEAVTTTTQAIQLAVLPPGDATAGEALFNMAMAVRFNDECSTCHSADGAARGWGPVLDGVSAEAGDRVEGLTGEEYLQQSIIAPRAYALEGWGLHMPTNYGRILSEQDIADLIAYLLEQ